MSGTTLFVVDMQHGFSSYTNCMTDVIREIELAKRRNDPIVFVELTPDSSGKTRPKLIKAAESGGYKKLAITTKAGGDGSKELVAAAKASGFQFKHVRVCGVNRNACVSNTIRGLMLMDDVQRVEVGFAATAPGPKKLGSSNSHYGNAEYHEFIKRGLILKK